MRIRYKPWARPELEASNFYIDNPQDYKDKWKTLYENEAPFHIELGCGKGSFISQLALKNQDINYLAVDLVDAMLGLAKRNIENLYKENDTEIKNVYLTRFDIERIFLILGIEDKVERIYINFCNPWPRGKHHKKRLTHTRQLLKYREFLSKGGEIYFKTDDDGLFNDSLIYFEESGYEIIKKTYDLANEEKFWDNIETEHEKMFKEQGIKIKALIARKLDEYKKDNEEKYQDKKKADENIEEQNEVEKIA